MPKTVKGVFDAVNAINLDPSLQLAIAYDSTDVTQTVVSSSRPDQGVYETTSKPRIKTSGLSSWTP